jgi:hypothetical protein
VLHLRGHEAVQIVQIDASDLFPYHLVGSGSNTDLLIPVWQGSRCREDKWLCVADIAPSLDVSPKLLRPTEWLACGSIPRSRYSAAWPVIDGHLCFAERKSSDLVELLTYFCGQPPDYVRKHEASGRLVYDWDHGNFVEKEAWARQEASVHRDGFVGTGLGLDSPASRFVQPSMFGYAGYLRGMIIMD